MRKVCSFRLSDEARTRLAEMMRDQGRSAGRVVEDLILRDPPESVVASAPSPRLTDGETVKQRLARVDTRIAEMRVGRHTTLTGKPFGPVPKKG